MTHIAVNMASIAAEMARAIVARMVVAGVTVAAATASESAGCLATATFA